MKLARAVTETEGTSLDALIRRGGHDPFGFEELVDAWNAVFDGPDEAQPETGLRTTIFEAAVDDALTAIARESESDIIGAQLRRMIGAFEHTALIVSPSGTIVTMNETAIERLDTVPGASVDSIGYAPLGGTKISAENMAAHDRRNSAGEVKLLRAVAENNGRPATLSLVPTSLGLAKTPVTLLFVIDLTWREGLDALLSRSFELTTSECAILNGFLNGRSLREIAADRGRSHATIRTQFQTVLSKTGANTQAELMRNMLGLSQFMGDVGKITDIALHPFRKRADMLRPGGRTVEVFLAGDLSGDLVIVIPSVTMRTFQTDLEARFRREGLCVATLCRPGYGGSDPPPPGMETAQCLAEDFIALQDQMGARHSVVLAQGTSTAFAFQLAGIVPERVSKLIIASALVPLRYLDATQTRSPLSAAFVRARKHSPTLFRLLMHAALRAWKIGGARRVHAAQLASYPSDLEYLKSRETLNELDAAMRARFAQGLDPIAADFEVSTSDWVDWAKDCRVPVTILHGTHDQSVPIAAVRAFAADFAETVDLEEISDAGFMLMLSHIRNVLAALKSPSPVVEIRS